MCDQLKKGLAMSQVSENTDHISNDTTESQPQRNLPVVISSVACLIIIGIVWSLKSPFFPPLASEKGVPASQYSLVISALEVVIFFTSIPAGNSVYFFGPKRFILLGLLFESIGNVGLGLSALIHNPALFVTYSVVCRVFEGTGQILLYVSLFSILVSLYPRSTSSVMSTVEFIFPIGMIIGPFIGGFLIEHIDFLYTFVIMGGLVFLMIPVMFIVVPNIDCQGAREPQETLKILKLAKIPQVWISIVAFIVSKLGSGFDSVALEPHLRQFELTDSILGLIFTGSALFYSVSVLVWGFLCGKGANPLMCIVVGLWFQIISMALVGPLAFIPVDPELYLAVPGVFIGAVGNAGSIIPALVFLRSLFTATSFPNHIDINAMVSAIYCSALSFGGSIGPIIGGNLFHYLKYRKGQFALVVLFTVMSIIYIYFYLMLKRRKRDNFHVHNC